MFEKTTKSALWIGILVSWVSGGCSEPCSDACARKAESAKDYYTTTGVRCEVSSTGVEACSLACNSNPSPTAQEDAYPFLAAHLNCRDDDDNPILQCERPAESISFSLSRPEFRFVRDPSLGFVDWHFNYSGPAQVIIKEWVTVLELADSSTITIHGARQSQSLVVGEEVQLDANIRCELSSCKSRFTIRNASGDLLQAGWQGLDPIMLPEISFDYADSLCAANSYSHDPSNWGRGSFYFSNKDLLVDNERVPPGSYLERDGLRIHNGFSRFTDYGDSSFNGDYREGGILTIR